MNRSLILRVLQSARTKPLGVEEILQRAGLDIGVKSQVRRELRDLVREGVVLAEGKRFVLPKEADEAAVAPAAARAAAVPTAEATRPVAPQQRPGRKTVVGTLTVHRDGYGFIAALTGGEDLFVPAQNVGDALGGDLVEAIPGPGRDARPIARSLRVLERRRQFAVGSYRPIDGKRAVVEARDTSLPAIAVKPTSLAKAGDVVRVRLDAFEGGVSGTVVSRLGQPGDPDAEVLSVAYGEGFSDLFPPDVLQAAELVPDTVRAEDKAGRRDLTGIDLVTIDGEDARDFDDAVYVERTSAGWRLVVAIADVTAYVTDGAPLDVEARRRATSVYFPQHVLPMLPERLSNGICSLNPAVERLCMVSDMVFDPDGRPVSSEQYPAVMLSKARCTYTQVAELLDGRVPAALQHVAPMLTLAGDLARRLTARRMERGAIDFDIPEGYVRLGADHQVEAIVRRPRSASHRLVEEFMLAANESVARYFESRTLPTVYRVHGPPKEEKLRAFADLARAYGYDLVVDGTGRIGADALNDFLERVAGRPEQRALNHLLLRSMMQAVYSSENIGHFGLAAPSYLHFTSPIRRYPDLIVHRLLKAHWARGGQALPTGRLEAETEALEETGVHCSERERAATSAEREIDAYYKSAFMVSRVGQRFAGTIASVAEFGLFVELDEPYVEGLVRAETIGPQATFDAERHRLVFGRGGGRAFSVGDRLEVDVLSADPVLRRIELRLVEGGQRERAAGEMPVRSLQESMARWKSTHPAGAKPNRPASSKPPELGGERRGRPGGRTSPGSKASGRPESHGRGKASPKGGKRK